MKIMKHVVLDSRCKISAGTSLELQLFLDLVHIEEITILLHDKLNCMCNTVKILC